jgi:hypothetical protein
MSSKETDEPTYTERIGEPCPSCGWCSEIVSTHKDGTITVACANCFLDKTQTKSKKRKSGTFVEGKEACSNCGSKRERIEPSCDGVAEVFCANCNEFKGLDIETEK